MKLFKKHQITDEQLIDFYGADTFADIEEQVKQTDAVKVQEYHKSAERIAQMIKDADERETW